MVSDITHILLVVKAYLRGHVPLGANLVVERNVHLIGISQPINIFNDVSLN